jgi:hypothetical protein
VVVLAGLAVTVAPVVADKPVDGDQEYEPAPLAVSVALPPEQIVWFAGGVTVALFTVMVVEEAALHGATPTE